MTNRILRRCRRPRQRHRRLCVESFEQRALLATFTVTHTRFTDPGSLFWAIEQANQNPGPDTINFNIPGGGVQTITPEFQFPIITGPVVIDATTQPGWEPDHPMIELDGSLMSEGNGLEIQVGGNTLKGLAVHSFPWDGVVFAETTSPNPLGSNIIQGNFFGTGAGGSVARGNGFSGLHLVDSPNNTIGGTGPGEGNLFAGNKLHGVSLSNQHSVNNRIVGNRIGTDITGMNPLGNERNGVSLQRISTPVVGVGYPSNNFIGNPRSGEGNVLESGGNVIAGNGRNGVWIYRGTGNTVQNNFIGVGLDGQKPVPNGKDGDTLNGNGVMIESAASNVVGGTAVGTGNLISGNKRNGVWIIAYEANASFNRLEGNLIGTDLNGEFAPFLGNRENGVEITNLSTDDSIFALGNLIGGADESDGNTDGNVLARNIISGNLDNGILVTGPRVTSNVVEGNYIGTDKSGTEFIRNEASGITVTENETSTVGPSATLIGSVRPGGGNVISGNAEGGVRILRGATLTSVVGNRIGTTADGLSALDNGPEGHGVFIEDSSNNVIGGIPENEGNVISGNLNSGVILVGDARNNRIQNNLIGVGEDGSTKLPNAHGVSLVGVPNGGTPSGNWIGGTTGTGEDETSLGNVIAANQSNGINVVLGATENHVISNAIGTNFDLEAGLGNGQHGVVLSDSSLNVIGGPTPASRNVIYRNSAAGIRIQGNAAAGNQVVGNDIVENVVIGIDVTEGPSSTSIFGNLITGNHEAGVLIGESGATTLRNNFIGTDGSEPLPNVGPGIWIFNSTGTVIGGTNYEDGGNLISGNSGLGIVVSGPKSVGTRISGNYIGVDHTATKPIGNEAGIGIGGSDALGGSASLTIVQGNVIAGNRKDGVTFVAGAQSNQVFDNFIGTNNQGATDLGNQGFGVLINDSPNNTIGGAQENASNLISSNTKAGIRVQGAKATGNVLLNNQIYANDYGIDIADGPIATLVVGNHIADNTSTGVYIAESSGTILRSNLIGTDFDGLVASPNKGPGVWIFNAVGSIIGGDSFEDGGNLISGNELMGILLNGPSTSGTIITGNYIGVDINDEQELGNEAGIGIGGSSGVGGAAHHTTVRGNVIVGNRADGIVILGGAYENTIGGPNASDGNRIAHNGKAGIAVTEGTGNKFLHNQIFDNIGLGIDLGAEGVTANDKSADSDSGANQLQNFPEMTLATVGASRRIAGQIKSKPSTKFVLEFFASPTPDPSGYGEGQRFVTSDEVTTNASGVAFFDVDLPITEVSGTLLTATATDPEGNTSEFSKSIKIEVDTDGDGISDRLESEAANSGDGNQDGVKDSLQPQVVSFPSAVTGSYLTLELGSRFLGFPAPAGAVLTKVRPLENPSPGDAPANAGFGLGFFDFVVTGLTPGTELVMDVVLPPATNPLSFYRYGPTPDNPNSHWYDWLFDGQTGATINGNRITLRYFDGQRGDDDLLANGTIVDPGGPAFAPPIVVTNTLDSGPGSLRQAILTANSQPALDFITFAIGEGAQTISPLSSLPPITDPVFIDGFSQPGYSGSPLIEISGQAITSGIGLTISAANTTVRGLAINRFLDAFGGAGLGIHVALPFSFQSNVVLQGNFIGTDITGTLPRPNRIGIVISRGSDHRIGGTTPETRNVISGNQSDAIQILSGTGHRVQGNLIGVAVDGTSPLTNGGHGVLVTDTFQVSIGGLDPSAGNIIAFNQGDGIQNLGATQNRRITVLSNSIYSNGLLGISRDGSHNPILNDAGTQDGLLANVINYPVLFSARRESDATTISGYLNSRPNSTFFIQFFSDTAVEVTGFGEGRTLLGTSMLQTDDAGHLEFTQTFPVAVPDGSLVTATSTLSLFAATALADTSEFSRRLAVGDVLNQVITVNTDDDVDDGVADAVHTSLREAIHAANNFPGHNVIRFAIGSGSNTIHPLRPLPVITEGVLVDGTTQPGFSGSPLIVLNGGLSSPGSSGLQITGSDTTIRGLVINGFAGAGLDIFEQVATPTFANVVIEGNFIGTDLSGMTARPNATGIIVRGGANHLIGGATPAAGNVISGNTQHGLVLSTGTGYQVQGNRIGVASDGVTALGNGGNGVAIPLETSSGTFTSRVTNVTIGGQDAAAGNVIAFNRISGIQNRQPTRGISILSNSIHDNALLGISMNLSDWVVLNERPSNYETTGKPQNYPVLGAAISTGGQTTISGYLNSTPDSTFLIQFFSSTAVEVSGFGEGERYLGSTSVITDAQGHAEFSAVLPVAVADRHLITGTATSGDGNTSQFSRRLAVGDVLGGTFTVNSTDDVDDGVADTTHTSLREAIHAANNHPGPSRIEFVIGSGTQTISPLTPLPAIVDAQTTIDGTTQNGAAGAPIIELVGTLMEREKFGQPSATEFYLTGLAIRTNDTTVKGLVINRFFEQLIVGETLLRSGGTALDVVGNGNIIEGNYFGTTVAGGALTATNSVVANRNIVSATKISGSNNRIGGLTSQQRNVISGHYDIGLDVQGTNNLVQGNYIGTNSAGTAAVGNGRGMLFAGLGARVIGQGNTVGGDVPGAGNVISGNNGHGLLVQGTSFTEASDGNVVQGNLIGLNAAGSAVLGNSADGIQLQGRGNIIGGTTAGERNVVSGNRVGIFLLGGFDNVVQGNYIGTDLNGTLDRGNTMDGIVVRGERTVIGGTDSGAGNLISGNNRFGILVTVAGTSVGHRIQGNRIGTQANGASALGNSSDGVAFAGDFNASTNGNGPTDSLIGGTTSGAGNIIAFNGRHGINILAGRRIAILSNSIHTNTQLGVDLNGNGITTNDAGDVDAGDNELQNFPVLGAALTDGARTSVDVTLNSLASTTFLVQFFANSAADASGNGEGQTLLGSRSLVTDNAGNVAFTLYFDSALSVGQFVTATATDEFNNTSEFSTAIRVVSGTVPPNQPPLASAGGPYTIHEGSDLRLDARRSLDPDGDALHYSWDVNGDGLFNDATGVLSTLSWSQLQPLGIIDGPSSFAVRVLVSDEQGHDVISEAGSLTILNVPPVADAGSDQSVTVGDTVLLTGSVTDPGTADTHTFQWHVTSDAGQEIPDGVESTFDIVPNHPGTFVVTLTVTDDDGDTDSAIVSVFVEARACWQNALNPLDVDVDGGVYPRDALIVINYLNLEQGPPALPAPPAAPPPFYDVNCDNFVSPVDALMVINDLNARSLGEGEAATGRAVDLVGTRSASEGASPGTPGEVEYSRARVLSQPPADHTVLPFSDSFVARTISIATFGPAIQITAALQIDQSGNVWTVNNRFLDLQRGASVAGAVAFIAPTDDSPGDSRDILNEFGRGRPISAASPLEALDAVFSDY